MSKMLERVAKAIELAQGNAPFYVMPMFKDKYGVVETMPPLSPDMYIKENLSHNEAEDLCEKLNGLWVAKKVVEALKPMECNITKEKYYQMAVKEGYPINTTVFPHAAWERAIDAILSGDK